MNLSEYSPKAEAYSCSHQTACCERINHDHIRIEDVHPCHMSTSCSNRCSCTISDGVFHLPRVWLANSPMESIVTKHEYLEPVCIREDHKISPRAAVMSDLTQFAQRLHVLWTALQQDSKRTRVIHMLCDVHPTDLIDPFPTHSSDESKAAARKIPLCEDLTMRIGIAVFFRLLQSLSRSQNTCGILMVMRQIPAVIATMPPLALWPSTSRLCHSQAQISECDSSKNQVNMSACSRNLGGVVESIISAAEELVSEDRHMISDQDQGEVLTALVGLAAKGGSLTNCLRVLKLILRKTLCAEDSPPLSKVGSYLKVKSPLHPQQQQWRSFPLDCQMPILRKEELSSTLPSSWRFRHI